MTPEHIKACSVHLLLFSPRTQRKESKGEISPLRYAEMFIPWLYSIQSPETSLAYHISPYINLHLDTERHFKGANNISVSKPPHKYWQDLCMSKLQGVRVALQITGAVI